MSYHLKLIIVFFIYIRSCSPGFVEILNLFGVCSSIYLLFFFLHYYNYFNLIKLKYRLHCISNLPVCLILGLLSQQVIS